MTSPAPLALMAHEHNQQAANLASTTLADFMMFNQINANMAQSITPESSALSQLQGPTPDVVGPSWANAPYQTPQWGLGPDLYDIDFIDLTMGHSLFLEDSLLPDFQYDPLEFCVPFQPAPDITDNQHPASVSGRLLLSSNRHVTPSEDDSTTGERPERNLVRRGLQLAQEDISIFKKRTLDIDKQKLLADYQFPTRVRMIRLLSAYFEYFDPQTPIVHRATFDVHDSHRK